MKTALIPVAAKFVEDEVIYQYYRLQEAGFKVEVYCKNPSIWKYGDCCYGKYGAPVRITQRNLGHFEVDLLYIPGGTESTEVLRQDECLHDLIKHLDLTGKLICFECHGAQVMISAGVVKGRRCTCYKGMMIDLKHAGAIVPNESERVVRDGNWVSGQHYFDNPEFMKAVLEQYHLLNEVIH